MATNVEHTKDPRKAIQFRDKLQAIAAAKTIGWRAKDVTAIEVMGFRMWSIGDDHCRLLTREGYLALAQDR